MKLKIAIWTVSPPKVNAIKEAVENCLYFGWKEIEYISQKVPSDVSDMPISLEENIAWAKNRANNIKKLVEADYYIGMEWWTTLIWEEAFLFGVVYIMNNSWEWHIWISNMMKVPNYFQKRIYEDKEELWPILSEITKEENASKKGWAFAHWSDDMLTRKDQFVLAFTSAVVPFYNKYYKM